MEGKCIRLNAFEFFLTLCFSLHYAPYNNDPRISHAHGWATGPTSTLTFYGAGLQVTSAAGLTWLVEPQLGGLQNIEAGYQTNVGSFSSNVTALPNDGLNVSISTPEGTSGSVRLRYGGSIASLTVTNLDASTSQKRGGDVMKRQISQAEKESRIVSIEDLPGGNYTIILETSM